MKTNKQLLEKIQNKIERQHGAISDLRILEVRGNIAKVEYIDCECLFEDEVKF